MTHWLKIRLFALMGGALFLGGAYLHAQDDSAPAAKTPEEAATNFYRFLDIVRQPGNFQSTLDEQTLARLMGSVQQEQFGSLGGGAANGGDKALALVANQAFALALDAQVQSQLVVKP